MRKKKLSLMLMIFAISVLLCSCKKEQIKTENELSGNNATIKNGLTSQPNTNASIMGVLVNAVDPALSNGVATLDYQANVNWAASALKVKYYRMGVTRDTWWQGINSTIQNTTVVNNFLNEYNDARVQGLDIILNILWKAQKKVGNAVALRDFPDQSKMPEYEMFLREVLEEIATHGNYEPGNPTTTRISDWYPKLIVVENEEDNETYYNITDPSIDPTPLNNYIKELTTAITINMDYTKLEPGNPNPNQPIILSNGGFTARMLKYLTYNYKININPQEGRNWASTSMPPSDYNGLTNTTSKFPLAKKNPSYPDTRKKLRIGNYLLLNYKSIQKTLKPSGRKFYLNIHWYEPSFIGGWDELQDGGTPLNYFPTYYPGPDKISPNALVDAISSLNDKYKNADGSPVFPLLTNETGQLTTSGTLTTNHLTNLFTTSLNPICWYDGDGDFVVNDLNQSTFLESLASVKQYKAKALHTNGIDANGNNKANPNMAGSAFIQKVNQ